MYLKKYKTIIISLISSAIIAGCGGGGGGGYIAPTKTSQYVPFATPQVQATYVPLVTSSYNDSSSAIYTQDLTGTGKQNVIVAGYESANGDKTTQAANWHNNQIKVFGWSGTTLVDQTSQWFSGTDNIIAGTDKLKFGDFNGSGKTSMFAAPYTDGVKPVNQAQIFVNTGDHFTRYDINLGYNIQSHDATTFRYNGVDNIVTLDYGINSTFIFGSNTNNFRAYSVNNGAFGGSSVAAGDFLNNGTTTFIVTDTSNYQYSTRLFSWSQDPGTGAVSVTDIGTLPLPRFELPKYDGILNPSLPPGQGENRSHNIRIIADDFDGSGVTSAIIISRPSVITNPAYGSEVQFLKNNGTGKFTDVTDTVLFNYDRSASASYQPVKIDLLNNGLYDWVLAGSDKPQVLMQISRGQYVASYANVLTDFANQVKDMLGNQYNYSNDLTFVRGPDNKLYLLNLVTNYSQGFDKSSVSLYLSAIGDSTSAINATATINKIKQQWPWMTDAQANQVLAATGKTWYGATIIDQNALWNPSGALNLATVSGLQAPSGAIAGIRIDGTNANMIGFDSLGRSFTLDMSRGISTSGFNWMGRNSENIDRYELTSHAEYLINAPVTDVGGLRMGYETRNQFNTMGPDTSSGPVIGPQPRHYSIGIPRLWNSGYWTVGMQYTTLPYNPWMAMSGSWGTVMSSATLDNTISYQRDGLSARVGIMRTTTQISPGLITRVGDVIGAWAEAGYRYEGLGIYAGVKPVALWGQVDAVLPNSINNQGQVVYTRKSLSIQNEVVGYIRALYTADITRRTSMRISGIAMDNGQYRIMHEMQYRF